MEKTQWHYDSCDTAVCINLCLRLQQQHGANRPLRLDEAGLWHQLQVQEMVAATLPIICSQWFAMVNNPPNRKQIPVSHLLFRTYVTDGLVNNFSVRRQLGQLPGPSPHNSSLYDGRDTSR